MIKDLLIEWHIMENILITNVEMDKNKFDSELDISLNHKLVIN